MLPVQLMQFNSQSQQLIAVNGIKKKNEFVLETAEESKRGESTTLVVCVPNYWAHLKRFFASFARITRLLSEKNNHVETVSVFK